MLSINNTESKSVGGLQFFQKSGSTALNPDSGWWSLLRTQHPGYDNGYWQEIAYAFGSDTIKFRRNTNGTTSAWKTLAFTDSDITGTAASATYSSTATYSKNSGTSTYSSNSAKATSATSATYATTATSAGSASKATSATSATYATTSTKAGTSTYATNAGTASYASNSRTYKGATTASAGTTGFVPAATTATRTSFLRGDGTWATPSNASSATYATKAAQDSSGNTITSTYAKKSIYGDSTISLGRKSGTTVGTGSVAIGNTVTASGNNSHAEGYNTTARGDASHSEGTSTIASGQASHAEGTSTIASGQASHAEGDSTIASGENQHVQGRYNVADASQKYAHIVGGGTSDSKRKNIHTLDWDGNAEFAGGVKCSNVLKTLTECEASTKDTDIASASALSELNTKSLKYKYIEFQTIPSAYSGALGGYRSVIDITNLAPSDGNIKAIIFNRCCQASDANRIGTASIGNSFLQVIVNASTTETYNISATILYT